MSDWRYTYEAEVRRIVDGDTVDLAVDLGFGVTISERFRLFGLDAPEVRGPERTEGLKSTQWLATQLVGLTHIETIRDKKGKYGRYLVRLFSGDTDINLLMVATDFAEQRDY